MHKTLYFSTMLRILEISPTTNITTTITNRNIIDTFKGFLYARGTDTCPQ